MKQHITKEQWDELSEEGAGELIRFFYDKDIKEKFWHGGIGYAPLRIGQMIEFLEKSEIVLKNWKGEDQIYRWHIEIKEPNNFMNLHAELCDALWEAVKSKLK